MTIPTLDQLFTPLSTEDVVTQSLKTASDLDLPVTAWEDVSVAREIIWINAANVSLFTNATSAAAGAGLLDYAKKDWLTLTAAQVYDTDRIENGYATGLVRLTNSSATPYTYLPGEVRIQNVSADGATYTSTTGGTLSAFGTLVLSFSADAPGTASNLTGTDVLAMVTSSPGVDPSWVADLIGTDEESDSALVIRSRLSVASVTPNGPANAYDYLARSTKRPDGTAIGVTRTKTVSSNAHVAVYVADADGSVISSDVALIQSAVNSRVVPTGITATVQSASNLAISIAMSVVRNPAAVRSSAEIQAAITSAIAQYFSTIPVGGDDSLSFQGIYRSTLVQLARNAGASDVLDVSVTTPAANVSLSDYQVPTISGSIAYTWA